LIAEDFVSPIQLLSSHNSERLYVVDQIGKVSVIDRNGYKRPTPFLDISSRLVSLNPGYDEHYYWRLYIYRGEKIESWQGKYIFGTFSQTPATPNGELYIATPQGNAWAYEEISLKNNPNDLGYYLRGFGQDDNGELYVTVSFMSGPQGNSGKVFRLVFE
jgi:hypothetical protein